MARFDRLRIAGEHAGPEDLAVVVGTSGLKGGNRALIALQGQDDPAERKRARAQRSMLGRVASASTPWRSRRASSRASTAASRRVVSAWRRASSSTALACCSAEPSTVAECLRW
jgi:hypothetical protein